MLELENQTPLAGANASREPQSAEQALAKVTARFNGIISAAMDAIVSVDAEQRIVLFNPAAERMFRLPASEAIGQDLERLIPKRFRPNHGSDVERFGKTGVSERHMGALGTVFGLRANGEEFPIEASISRVEVGGEVILTAILRDITKRKRAEEALRLSHEELEKLVQDRTAKLQESLANLEEFSYALVHDIRAPLRAMQIFAGLLEEECAEFREGPARDYLQRITMSAARLSQLLQDTLAYSQIAQQELPMGPVDLAKVLGHIMETDPSMQTPGAEIWMELDGVVVRGNEAGLMRCFSNLLSNAVKFVAPGRKPFVRVWAEKSDSTIRIWVEDNGIGIPKAAQAKIFGMFQRMHHTDEYPGTGIGLAIVRKAAQRMGGKVGVESEPGKGSRFWVELRKGNT